MSTRSVIFVFLLGPPRTLTRREGMELHDAVCRKLGSDDFSFQYSATDAEPPAKGKAFKIVLERSQGRGMFRVLLDNSGQGAPVRFFVESPWPRSTESALQDVDLAWEAAADVLGSGWARVLAEARIRSQVEAKGESAVTYMADDILHLGRDGLEAPISFVSARYETQAGHPEEGDALARPKRDVTVEVLRDDPRCLYIELMSQWPQLAGTGQGGTLELDPRKVRTFSDNPSAYLQNSIEYLNTVVRPLFTRPREQGRSL